MNKERKPCKGDLGDKRFICSTHEVFLCSLSYLKRTYLLLYLLGQGLRCVWLLFKGNSRLAMVTQ